MGEGVKPSFLGEKRRKVVQDMREKRRE